MNATTAPLASPQRHFTPDPHPEKPLFLGVSTCLLGQAVRYDGGHKHDRFLTDMLGRFVRFVPVCPEVECGLGVPREAMRLVGEPSAPRLVTIKTGIDHTDRMLAWANKRVAALAADPAAPLCGFVFKSKSPSSGMERVKVYGKNGHPVNSGVGLFARVFMEHFPLLPVEEEGRLHDARLRENFIERIFLYKRWRDTVLNAPTPAALVAFHTRHKLLFMSHSQEKLRAMGKLVAGIGDADLEAVLPQYAVLMMHAATQQATTKKQRNVLLHAMGYFKRQLGSDEKQELLEVIDQYAAGLVPLIVPVTLLNHYIRKYAETYLQGQWWLQPHPMELALRNHA
ncbi:YbgA family protein [Megalodesulfovibrio paquesii]